ncbi:MAG: LPXTG cell wall anchor domain-containing protein, partial [Promethearchaeota archaeon]
MFWKRLKSFTSQNYSIFTFLAAILSITISLSSVTGPSIYILLFILLVALALFLLIKRRKQNKI